MEYLKNIRVKKQVALIGVTGFGANHLLQLTNLARQNLLEIAAAVIINPEAAGDAIAILQEFNTRIYPDAETFFARECGAIDLVCIPTGIDSHESLTVAALGAGMNVLLEKPASGSVASVQRMIAAAKSSGKFVSVGFQHIFAPEIQFIKRILLSRQLGDIRNSLAMACWPRGDNYYQRNSWAAKRMVRGVPVLDSPLNNACAHYLNLLLFLNGGRLNGAAGAVNAAGNLWRARPEIEMFDACDVTYTLDNGSEARIMLAHCCRENIAPKLKIVCEKGTVLWHNNGNWSITGEHDLPIAGGVGTHPGETMFRAVLARLDDPDQMIYPLDNALKHTGCIELLDKNCPIQPVGAVYSDGIYMVSGIEQQFNEIFER